MRPRVLVTEPIHEVGLDILRQESDLVNLADRPGETLEQHLPSIQGMIVRIAPVTAARLAAAPHLRIVGKHGVGVDNIDLEAARRHNVIVTSTPGANDEAVAEHALMMMLMLARQVTRATDLMRSGKFNEARRDVRAVDLHGKTLGLIGLGRIGSRLAHICRASLDMHVLAFDPYVTEERARQLGVERVNSVDQILTGADVISIHTPLTPETRHLIGSAELARMRPSGLLINCARGGLIDEHALAAAISQGTIAGAGIDAFVDEPPAQDNPLLHLERVVVTPHIAGNSEEALRRMAQIVAEDVLRVLHGDQPHHPVR